MCDVLDRVEERGKIIGFVEAKRDDGKSEREIIAKLMEKYSLSEKEAEEYVLQPV